MTTLLEAAKTLIKVLELEKSQIVLSMTSGRALEQLEQAIAQEQSKTIRNCITCKYSHEPANSAVCTDCKHAYTSADHWEPKP